MRQPIELLRIFAVVLFCDAITCAAGAGVPLNGGKFVSELNEENANSAIEVLDDVFMSFSGGDSDKNDTIVNIKMKIPDITGGRDEIDVEDGNGIGHNGRSEVGRKHDDKKLLQKLLPLFILPFLVQSAIVPMFLSMLKMMLMKSLMVGKLALALIVFNAFRNSNMFKSRSEEEIVNAHYGYHGAGMEEYGAYVNRRDFKL